MRASKKRCSILALPLPNWWIATSGINMDHDVYCGAADPPDRVRPLLACFLIDPVFFQYPAFIGKHAGGERKGNTVFFPIQAVLSFVPFQPHVYIVYIYSCRGIKFKSR